MRGKSELNLSPSDQAHAACCWRPTNGGTSPAQHRDGNGVSKGRNKGGTHWQRDGIDDQRDESHRITENRPIGSNPTIATQIKALGLQDPHGRWGQQGTRAGWSHLDMNTVPTHTALLPTGSVMLQTHSRLKRGFRDMQGQHPHHLHL